MSTTTPLSLHPKEPTSSNQAEHVQTSSLPIQPYKGYSDEPLLNDGKKPHLPKHSQKFVKERYTEQTSPTRF